MFKKETSGGYILKSKAKTICKRKLSYEKKSTYNWDNFWKVKYRYCLG